MAKNKKAKLKYSFGTDFQEQILKYIVTNPKGSKALNLIDDTFFTLIPHAMVCYAIKKYFKKRKKTPGKPYLKETLRLLMDSGYRDLANILDEDREEVDQVIERLYDGQVSDEESIIDAVIRFAQYVKFKDEIESSDPLNFEAYETKAKSFNDILRIGKDITSNPGTFLVRGMVERAFRRNDHHESYPTPFWQLNQTMNSGGTTRGNLICVIAEEKRFKTGLLVNVARGYLKRKKKGVYYDLENGEIGITIRNEQSFANKTRAEILSEENDKNLLKLFRRYNRIGAELVIHRFPALLATTDDFQAHLDMLREDYNFVPDFAIVDYGQLMAARSGKSEDFGRISDAFIDLKNFAADNNLEALWTVAHVVREASKRRGTKYQGKDIAKCIDIPRHVDMLLGLQESDEEKEAGVMRLEVIEQRDGTEGSALFWVDFARQRLKEFTKAEVKEYREQLGKVDKEDEDEEPKKKKRKIDI